MKITIILPCYNIDNTLFEKCIKSIESQTLNFNNIEIILVDDCSTINNDTLINYANKHNNVIYCKTETNGGCCVARNDGISLATGDYFTILDPDDMYANNNVLEKIYNILISETPDIIFSTFCINNPNNYIRINELPLHHSKTYTNKSDSKYILKYPPCSAAKFWKTSFIKEYNLLHKTYRNSSDALFMLETYIKSNKITIFNEPIIIYNVHENSITTKKTYESLIIRLNAKIEFDTIALNNGYNPRMLTFDFNWIKNEIINHTNIPNDKKQYVNELINKIKILEKYNE